MFPSTFKLNAIHSDEDTIEIVELIDLVTAPITLFKFQTKHISTEMNVV